MLRRPRRHRPLLPAFAASLLLIIVCALGAAHAARPRQSRPPQQAAQRTIRVNSVVFEGLERVSRQDALAKVGLEQGRDYTPEFIDEAANRLAESGLFRSVGYGVSGRTDGATVTFKVVEDNSSLLPVVFDNFVWFTDAELAGAVRRRLPDFDGKIPEAGSAAGEAARALEELLAARKIAGKVEHSLSADAAGRNPEHVFTVTGASLRVCRLSFPGARTFTEEFLTQKSGGVFANEYSRKFVSGFAEATLLPLYHERGLLRAGFLAPRAGAYKGEDCEEGLSVTLPVEEGSIYVWDRAEWTGNEALSAKELDAALGMRARDVANGLRFDRGLAAVKKAYGRKGYLAAALAAAPAFDDENRRVSYRIQVKEGPLYRMGELTITGLSEQDANNLRGRWRLLHAEPFDGGYLDEFKKTTVPEFLKFLASEGRPLTNPKLASSIKPDRDRLTVDVTLEFK